MKDLDQENPFFLDLPTLDLTRFSNPPNPPSIGEKYLVFFLDDEFYAVPSQKVVEVAPTIPVTVLPNAPEWLLGIANLRGEVISVVSLPALLGKKNSKPASKPKFIILRSSAFESGAAFTADRISEIVTVPDEEIKFKNAAQSLPIFGKTVRKSQTLNLIDTEKLFASLKF